MHTDSSKTEKRIHSSHEQAVDARTEAGGNNFNLFHDGFDDPTNAALATKQLARRSHAFYKELVRIFAKKGFNARVREITQNRLNDGANVIADLIDKIDIIVGPFPS